MTAAIILSGSGVYDGSEIHEAVFTLLALEEQKVKYQIFAPNKTQYHVIDHLTGEEMNEKRNVLRESARIARGKIKDLKTLNIEEYDFLVIPGGFGAAKNLNQWAVSGPDGALDQSVQDVITDFYDAKKTICGLCMGPTVIAQALQHKNISPSITVGSTEVQSPYDIAGINDGLSKIGAKPQQKNIKEIEIDINNRIITAPCYMLAASLLEVRNNITQAISATIKVATQ